MGETWKYGSYDLNTQALLEYLQRNADSYMVYHNYDQTQKQKFRTLLSEISEGIREGRITGNGYGSFSDSQGLIEESDITPKVFRYIHTVANAMGKKYQNKPENVETDNTGDLQDYNGGNHGFLRYFFEQTDPTLLNSEITESAFVNSLNNWSNTFDSTEEAVKDFSRMLNLYKDRHDYSKLNFSKIGTTSEQYLKDVDDLQKATADGVLDKKDLRLLNKLGLQSLSPFLYNVNTEVKPEVKPVEGAEVKPGEADIKPEEVIFTEPEKALSNNENAWNYYVVAKNLFKEESDQYRFAGLMADIISIVDPEPITAASAGYASDTLNLLADEKDGINDNYWDDALNYGLSTLGAIPIIGDIGIAGKITKNISKYAKVLGKLALVPSVTSAFIYYPELKQSWNNFTEGNFTVEDVRNAWTVIQLALGVRNVTRSVRARNKANQLNDSVEEALIVKVKNANGTKKELQFQGNDRTKLESLIDDPEGFKKYLRDNYKGLEEIELANISTKGGGLHGIRSMIKEKSLTKPKTKYVETRVAKVYNEGVDIPKKWGTSRAAHLINPGEKIDAPIKKTQEDFYGPKADTTPKTEAPKTDTPQTGTSTVTSTDTPKTGTSAIDIPPGKFDDTGVVGAATDIKPDITPDIKSGASEKVDTKSAVSGFTKNDIIAKLQGLTKEKIRKKAVKEANNIKINPSIASEVAKGTKDPSAGFNHLLSYLQQSGVKYDDAFKMLTSAGYYEQGGILKAEGGTKFYGIIKDPYNANSTLNGPFNYDSKNYESLWGGAEIEGDFDTGSYRPESSVTQKTSATKEELADLETYSKQYLPYDNSIKGQSSRINDIVDALNDFIGIKQLTLDEAVGTYNYFIDSMYNYKRNYGKIINHRGDETKRFNFTHRSIYKTPNSENGLYGYDSNLEHINGTTTIQRGIDRTDNDIQISSKTDITDGASKGTLTFKGPLFEALGSKKLFKSTTGHLYLMDGEPDETVTDKTDGTDKADGTDGKKKKDYNAEEELEVPELKIQKPDRPSDNFFTADKALGALNYYKSLKYNNKAYNLAKTMTPLLYDPLEHHRYVVGDIRALMNGQEQAAKIRNTAAQPITSDANLYAATQLDSQNLASQYLSKGKATDDAAMKDSAAKAFEQEKDNKENRYNIAMKNRENIHAVNKEKLMALMAKERANYESETNFINEWRQWLLQEHQKNQGKKEFVYSRQLQNYIKQNPQEYVDGWGKLHEQAWNNYNAGKTLTAAESNIVKQIERILQDAYYNELYSGKNNSYGVTLPSWEDNYLDLTPQQKKEGGKLLKIQTDYILKFLKESNANYNKAIERSIKGLYNHIKLQQKNK